MNELESQYGELERRAKTRRWVRCVSAPGGLATQLVDRFAQRHGAYLACASGRGVLSALGTELDCAPSSEAVSAALRERGIDGLCVMDATPSDQPELLELAGNLHVVAVVLGTNEPETFSSPEVAGEFAALGIASLVARAEALTDLYRPRQILQRWATDRSFLDADASFATSLRVAVDALPSGFASALQRLAVLPVAVPVEVAELACRGTDATVGRLVESGWVTRGADGFEVREPYRDSLDSPRPAFLEKVGDALVESAHRFVEALRSPQSDPATLASFLAADAVARWIAETSPAHRPPILRAFAALSELRTVEVPADRFLAEVDPTVATVELRLAAARRMVRDGEDAGMVLADANALALDDPALAARCQVVIATDVAPRDGELATRKLVAAQARLEEGTRDWALVELRLGHMALQRRQLSEAHQFFVRSLQALRKTLPPVWHVDAMSSLAYTHVRRDELLVARDHYEQALQILEDAGDAQRAPLMAFNLGTVLLALQDTAAEASLRRALTAWEERGEEKYFATAHVQLGLLALVFSQSDADRALAEAVRWGQWTADDNSVQLASGLLALSTRASRSEASFVASLREVTDALSVEHFPVEWTMLQRLLGAAPVELTIGEDERYVRAALRALDDPSEPSAHPWVVLFRRYASAAPRVTEKAHVLTVGPACEVFRIDDGERVDISRREPLKRILQALVEAHQKSQRYGFSVDDLIGVGWPGEILERKAGANRVYTAVRFLRAAGLEDCLVKSHEGYRIAPRFAVVSDVKL